jgi:hypothetical protein
VYFAVDSAVGKRVLSVDGQEMLTVIVQEKTTKYVGMERYVQVNDEFSLREAELPHADSCSSARRWPRRA